MVADFRVDGIGKVNGRGISWESDHLSHRSKAVDLFRVEIYLQAAEKLSRITDFALGVQELAQPAKLVLPFHYAGLPFFVLPVSCDPFFRNTMHLAGTDLNLEGLPIFPNDGCVQRLIEVGTGNGDIVFDSSRHGLPEVMGDAKNGVTVTERIRDHTNRNKIEDFIDTDMLSPHFVMNTINPLDPAFGASRDLSFRQLRDKNLLSFFDEVLADRPACFDESDRVLIGLRIQKAESQVLQFAANFCHAEPMGKRRIDFESLQGDSFAALRRQVLKGAHVVQAVG